MPETELTALVVLHRAARELAAGHTAEARELLEGCPPESRRFVWRFLMRRAGDASLARVQAHPPGQDPVYHNLDGVYRLRYLDAETLVTVGKDGSFALWDAGTLTERFRSPAGGYEDMAVNGASGRIAVAAGDDVEIWEVASGPPARVHTLGGHPRGLRALAFSSDGGRLAVVSGLGRTEVVPEPVVVTLWNARTGAREHVVTRSDVDIPHAAAFSPDGAILAVGTSVDNVAGGYLELYDSARGTFTRTLRSPVYGVYDLAFFADGARLALAGGSMSPRASGYVAFWAAVVSLETGVVLWSATTRTRSGKAVALDPTGRRLALSGDGAQIQIFDAARGELREELVGPPGGTRALAFHPTDGTLTSGGHDGRVRRWERGGLAPHTFCRAGGRVQAMVVDPSRDALHLAIDRPGVPGTELQRRSLRTGRLEHSFASPLDVRALSLHGRWLAGASGAYGAGVAVWDAATGDVRSSFVVDHGQLSDVLFLGAGLLATADSKDGVTLWESDDDFATVRRGRSIAHPYVRRLARSPDGRRFAHASAQRLAVMTLPGAEPTWVDEATDGTGGSVALGDTTCVWARTPHFPRVTGELRRWARGEPIPPLRGTSYTVDAMALSPDNVTLASAAANVVQLWDLRAGEEALLLRLDDVIAVEHLAFASEDQLLAGCFDGRVLVLKGEI